jgi:hypothetical protein
MRRPTGITILGILEIISGIIFAIVAIAIGAIAGMGGYMGGMGGGVMSALGGALAAIFALGAVLSFLIAGALFSGKRWGRTITIVFSIISLIIEAVSLVSGNPFAIASVILNIIILWYMWRPHVIAYFNR